MRYWLWAHAFDLYCFGRVGWRTRRVLLWLEGKLWKDAWSPDW